VTGVQWAQAFYRAQEQWAGVYTGPVRPFHEERAAGLLQLAQPGSRVLELGCGGGQFAAAAARLGYQVTAVDFVPELVAATRRLAEDCAPGSILVVDGDFLEVELDGAFEVVCYWDGFGTGADSDQRRLLARVESWLTPGGVALIEVLTPWYWASHAGASTSLGDVRRTYSFDADGCRMVDTWSRGGQERTQSLRCYSPQDLRLLLEGGGLRLASVTPGGAVEDGKYVDHCPLERAMAYVARLVPGGAAHPTSAGAESATAPAWAPA
jgi:SAM-dependent methyltransferase